MRNNKIKLRSVGAMLSVMLACAAGSPLIYGSTSQSGLPASAVKSKFYVLPDKLCDEAYETLPQCADSGGECQSRYSSSYLAGAPRSTIAVLQTRNGFNVAEFDKFCYQVCLDSQSIVGYEKFKRTACRANK